MGTSTRRDEPWGSDSETLERYASGSFGLLAVCQTPDCGHVRRMVVAMLLRLFPAGPATTLGVIRRRLRCHKCGGKRVALKVYEGGRAERGK